MKTTDDIEATLIAENAAAAVRLAKQTGSRWILLGSPRRDAAHVVRLRAAVRAAGWTGQIRYASTTTPIPPEEALP